MARRTHAEAAAILPAPAGKGTTLAPLGAKARLSRASVLRADRRLVNRCLAGEVAAWEEIYTQCHDRLCDFIRIALGRENRDPNLVDELASRVWYALVANKGRLLSRYAPERGARLATFMNVVAKDEIHRHMRSEARRLRRELLATGKRVPYEPADAGGAAQIWNEFLATLTPAEREFCTEFLLARASAKCPRYSAANVWQRTRRIYKKLLKHMAAGT